MLENLIQKKFKTTSRRIAVPALLTIVLYVIAMFIIFLPHIEESFFSRKKEMIQELTETVWSLLENYHERELSGELTRPEAQKRALLRIGKLRYGPEKKDYFWISDITPRMIMHPYRSEIVNKDIKDIQDPGLKRLYFRWNEIIAEEGEGFVDYKWQWKDDPTRMVDKYSYIKGFQPWDWIVGTGMYIDDIYAEINAIRNKFIVISTVILSIVLMLSLYSIRQTMKADKELMRTWKELKKSRDILRANLEETVRSLALAEEKRDPYTAGHQTRVDRLACAIARELGLSDHQIEGLHFAALLHDIGKIALPSEFLSKPTLLSHQEHEIIKCHVQAGYDILKNIDFPWPVAEMVYQHHEYLDGSGYPRNLTDKDILLEAKILTVADVVEAISSHRPYRPSLGIEAALGEIRNGRGIRYHAPCVDACLKLIKDEKMDFSGVDHKMGHRSGDQIQDTINDL